MDIPAELIQAFGENKNVVVLTGAGISKESGIPTFREAQTGLWAKYDPMELATPEAFKRNPELVWEWYQWRRDLVANAEPNPGHLALATFENKIKHFTLITQNVDGLHARAGSKNIIELHGRISRTKCFDNGHIVEAMTFENKCVPTCPECGSLLRPDVVWFGENLDSESIDAAYQASKNANTFISIGTSSIIEPAASLPLFAFQYGAVLVEINPQPTPISEIAHFIFRGPSGEILPELVKNIWKEE